MKVNIKLDGNKWNKNVNIEKMNSKADNKIDKKILVSVKELYPTVPQYRSGKIFFIMYLRKIIKGTTYKGFIICPINYGESHLHFVKNIYWYKE